MSFKSKFVIMLLLLLALGLPMLIKGPDGRPIMTVNDWVPELDKLVIDTHAVSDTVESLQSAAKGIGSDRITASAVSADQSAQQGLTEADPNRLSRGSGKMYKWQDDSGQWHFSSEKPKTSQQASIEDLPDVENVMEPPVTEDNKSSTIGLPDVFGLGGG